VEAPPQRDVKAVGEEGDEDVRLDPRFELMEDRADREIALEVLESFLHRDELQIVTPEFRRIVFGEIGAQQVATSRRRACRSLARSSRYVKAAPRVATLITLDIDDTCDTVHGHQQLSLFNAHYDERCFLPIHIYDAASGKPVAMILREGKTPSGEEVRTVLKHVIKRIRRHWPKVDILVRGDSHWPPALHQHA
jgi:hypothetical protein